MCLLTCRGRRRLADAQYVRPLLQRLGEERVCDAEDDGRRRLAAAQLRQLLEVGVVDGEKGPVVAAVAQRPHQTVTGQAGHRHTQSGTASQLQTRRTVRRLFQLRVGYLVHSGDRLVEF